MMLFRITEEGNGQVATVEARTAEAALRKARRACDYNGYRGPVTWAAFEAGAKRASGTLVVYVK